MTGPISIQTPRLVLREHLAGDLLPLHALLSDPVLMEDLPGLFKCDPDETRDYLSRCMRDADAAPRLRANLAVVDASGALIGSAGLHHLDGPADAGHWSLGYFIRRDRWGQGLAAEAVRAATAYLFERGAARVSASCLWKNIASRRVLEKCGLTREAVLLRHTWQDGRWHDCAVYRMLREEYDSREERACPSFGKT